MKIITQNKKALFDYDVLDRLETGIVLTGDEVKSCRAGNVSLMGSFANMLQGELYLINARISPYTHAYEKLEDAATRSRKLLIHKAEFNKLVGDISRKGITLVPLKMYFNEKNKVKVEIGLCRHKKAAGKKQALKERDIKRETERELRDKY